MIVSQAWASRSGEAPTPNLILPVMNYRDKPRGGMWTSTLRCDGSADLSAWESWARGAGGLDDCVDRPTWVLIPDPAARVIEVDGCRDMDDLLANYSWPTCAEWRGRDAVGCRSCHGQGCHLPALGGCWEPRMDFVLVAADGFDAVHMTARGIERLRRAHPEYVGTWECESTVWFRWAFAGRARRVR
jgi:hypothetical protein